MLKTAPSLVRAFLCLSFKRKLLLFEAAVSLKAAQILLRLVAFRRLESLFTRSLRGPELQEPVRGQVRDDVRWAIRSVSPFVLKRRTCFPRAIAAWAMLRRRKIATDLYYGAAVLPEQGLMAHVWLMDGEIGVIEYLGAPPYKVLAIYSAAPRKAE